MQSGIGDLIVTVFMGVTAQQLNYQVLVEYRKPETSSVVRVIWVVKN